MRQRLAMFTSARVGLGRSGASLPLPEVLRLSEAHAAARDAVHAALDVAALAADLSPLGLPVLTVRSAASDRQTYLKRPDLGRQLDEESRQVFRSDGSQEVVFVIADGLSAFAIQNHAARFLSVLLPSLDGWKVAPLVIATQARVALGDEIGERLGAKLCVVLIGERPGLSSPDSMGAYLTYQPAVGRTDAERNCISNIHGSGLSYEVAATRLLFLLNESRRRKLSGVGLKENSGELLLRAGEAALPAE
jgi:ethanolamine ammonia-lyase small subunit